MCPLVVVWAPLLVWGQQWPALWGSRCDSLVYLRVQGVTLWDREAHLSSTTTCYASASQGTALL